MKQTITYRTFDLYNHHSKRLAKNAMTQLKSVHKDGPMQGRTAAHAVDLLSGFIYNGWKEEDSQAASEF